MKFLSSRLPKIHARRSKHGFTLIEVSISLGLVGFALVTVIGLLPTGMSALRQSMNQTVEAQILQSIASRAVTSNFANLTDDTLYFDDEGLPVPAEAAAHYEVDLTITDPSFPGSGNAAAITQSLKNLRVDIALRQNQTTARNTHSYSIHVANSGY